MAAGAEFANIAVADPGAGQPATANLYHASSLIEAVAQRYMVIPIDESTPLGTVLRSEGEVWLRSLSDIGTRYRPCSRTPSRPGWLRRHPLPCMAGATV